MAKICVLDGYTLNPGDLSWKRLKNLGTCIIFDRTRPDEIVQRAAGAEIVLTNKVVIGAKEMDSLPTMKYIGVLATGYNVVNIAEASRRGIVVTNIPAYSTMSVAQMVFAHIMNITQHVTDYAREVSSGKWTANADFCYWNAPLMELAGKTIGIIGLGHTGMATARIALAFGMKVVAQTSKSADKLPEGIVPVALDQLFAESDIISLHCPLTESTRNLINKDTLAHMKRSAILINTGRGPLVNEKDLADALNQGIIAAAGADVLSTEPPAADNPLLTARNCFITPHIAWATTEARTRLMDIAVENVRQYLAGEPVTNAIKV